MVETEKNPKLLWERCLDIIRDNISQEQFAASFAFVELHSFEDGKLVLDVPSEFVKKMLEDKFLPLMISTFKRVFNGRIKALYYNVKVVNNSQSDGEVIEKTEMPQPVVNGPARQDVRKTPGDVTAPQVQDLDSQLIPDYRFLLLFPFLDITMYNATLSRTVRTGNGYITHRRIHQCIIQCLKILRLLQISLRCQHMIFSCFSCHF